MFRGLHCIGRAVERGEKKSMDYCEGAAKGTFVQRFHSHMTIVKARADFRRIGKKPRVRILTILTIETAKHEKIRACSGRGRGKVFG